MYRLVMAIRPDTLPTDPAALTEMVLALDAENETSTVMPPTKRSPAIMAARSNSPFVSPTPAANSSRCIRRPSRRSRAK